MDRSASAGWENYKRRNLLFAYWEFNHHSMDLNQRNLLLRPLFFFFYVFAIVTRCIWKVQWQQFFELSWVRLSSTKFRRNYWNYLPTNLYVDIFCIFITVSCIQAVLLIKLKPKWAHDDLVSSFSFGSDQEMSRKLKASYGSKGKDKATI